MQKIPYCFINFICNEEGFKQAGRHGDSSFTAEIDNRSSGHYSSPVIDYLNNAPKRINPVGAFLLFVINFL